MARFVGRETKTIRAEWWEEGEEVAIRRFSYGDRQAIMQACTSMRPEVGEDGEPTGARIVTQDLAALNLEMLCRGIARWTFVGENGKLALVRKHWIEQLENRDGEFILAEIEAYNRGRDEEGQASFRGAAGGGAAGG